MKNIELIAICALWFVLGFFLRPMVGKALGLDKEK